jgi:hypothetical protein
VPIPLIVRWAGDTPVITLTDLTIPGVGTFTTRLATSPASSIALPSVGRCVPRQKWDYDMTETLISFFWIAYCTSFALL